VRPIISGNSVSFSQTANTDDSYASFRKYLDVVYNYAGTISVNRETEKVTSNDDISSGDIIITPGSPGHAVMIVGVAINKNKENMTWEKFDNIQESLPAKISNEIILIRQRNKNNLLEFNKYSYIIHNSYYNDFVHSNIEQIKKNYRKYKICNDFDKLKKLQFNCEVFQHAILTQHYYHISHKGNKFKSLLTLYNEMFDNIKNYIYDTNLNVHVFNHYIENYNLIGEIDFIDSNNQLWEIKVAQDINLKYILQLLIYNIMFEKKNEYKLNFLNFLRGEKVIIKLNLDDNKINRLIEIFQKYSESKK
jgi:hypothetical protein